MMAAIDVPGFGEKRLACLSCKIKLSPDEADELDFIKWAKSYIDDNDSEEHKLDELAIRAGSMSPSIPRALKQILTKLYYDPVWTADDIDKLESIMGQRVDVFRRAGASMLPTLVINELVGAITSPVAVIMKLLFPTPSPDGHRVVSKRKGE